MGDGKRSGRNIHFPLERKEKDPISAHTSIRKAREEEKSFYTFFRLTVQEDRETFPNARGGNANRVKPDRGREALPPLFSPSSAYTT